MVVRRYAILKPYQIITVPQRAEFLCAQWQSVPGQISLWVWCNPDDTTEVRRSIHLVETDEPMPVGSWEYISTVIRPSGIEVHVFSQYKGTADEARGL